MAFPWFDPFPNLRVWFSNFNRRLRNNLFFIAIRSRVIHLDGSLWPAEFALRDIAMPPMLCPTFPLRKDSHQPQLHRRVCKRLAVGLHLKNVTNQEWTRA